MRIRGVLFALILLSSTIAKADWLDSFREPPRPTVAKQKLQELENKIKALVPGCIADLEKKFELPWKRQESGWPERLHVGLMSKLEAALSSDVAATHGHFLVRMNFDPYPLINGNADLKSTVCHESVHAYFRHHMSLLRYLRFPRWAREGSAVYLSGQLREKEYRALFRSFANGAMVINGLEDKHTLEDLFEDGLAFNFLQEDGQAAVSILRQVLVGKELYDAIKEDTGLAHNDLLLQTQKYARTYVEQRRSSLLPATLTAIKEWGSLATHQQAGDYFVQKMKDGLTSEPNLAAPSLDFAMSVAFSLQLAQNKEGALLVLPMFKQVEAAVPSYLYGQNLALLRNQIADLSLKTQQYADALAYYTRIYNEHPETKDLQKAAPAGILRSLVGLKNWQQVLLWSKNEKDLDQSTLAEYHYYRGLAYRGLKKDKKAKKLFSEVCKSEQNAEFKVKACQELISQNAVRP